MVLGSDVSLEKDILKKPINFVRNELEWNGRNTEIITRGFRPTAHASGTTTLFTVPKGKTFFLTSLNMTLWANNAINTVNGVRFNTSRGITLIDTGIVRGASLDVVVGLSFVHDYSMPIKIEEGDSIQVIGTARIGATITGWLESKFIS